MKCISVVIGSQFFATFLFNLESLDSPQRSQEEQLKRRKKIDLEVAQRKAKDNGTFVAQFAQPFSKVDLKLFSWNARIDLAGSGGSAAQAAQCEGQLIMCRRNKL